jgi:hypothetical protein
MTKNKIILTLAICLFTSMALAQQKVRWDIDGKKNLISGQMLLHNTAWLSVLPYLDLGTGITYRRILNKKWEFNANYSFSQNQKQVNFNPEDGNTVVLETNGLDYTTEQSYQVALRRYRLNKGGFSPIGKYFKFGITYKNQSMFTQGLTAHNGHWNRQSEPFDDYFEPTDTFSFAPQQVDLITRGIVVGFGREIPIKNNLFFGFGVDATLALAKESYRSDTSGEELKYDNGEYTKRHPIETAPGKFFLKDIFVAHYSVSYLF